MKNARYTPKHALLKQVVRYHAFQTIGGTGIAEQWMTLFPNGTNNLCITLDSALVTKGAGRLQNHVATSCTRPVVFNRSDAIEMIGVQFEPYGFHLLTGLAMKEHKNNFFHLDDFFSAATLQTLYQQLHGAEDDGTKVDVLEQFILQQLSFRNLDRRILFAIHQIQRNPQLQLDQLVNHLNLSARRLRDLFALHVGISPKYFLRLCRFNHAAHRVSDCTKSLTEVAIDSGYFDQAHFIKEFREFGAVSPNRFRRFAEKSAEFYNS
ncbi:MAG: hypothetical protein DHS20C11_20940 [Lysobacteraceae bacterium]|nr:MAG: hypothetical protein DHS20C11_20940 [Xanthomonadaceae bacterium]